MSELSKKRALSKLTEGVKSVVKQKVKPYVKRGRAIAKRKLDNLELSDLAPRIAATGMVLDAIAKKRVRAKINKNLSLEYKKDDDEEKIGIFFNKSY